MITEVSSVRWEVCLDKCSAVVIVSHISYRVPKNDKCRNQRFPMCHIENQN